MNLREQKHLTTTRLSSSKSDYTDNADGKKKSPSYPCHPCHPTSTSSVESRLKSVSRLLSANSAVSAVKISPRLRLKRAGFTLIELMLSVAMVLVLIVGVNYVFQTTTDAIGAGQASSTAARDSQSAQTLLFDDFKNVSKNPPCFIIASQFVTQFLNSADAQTGDDPRKIVLDTAGTFSWIGYPGDAGSAGAASFLSPAILNYRSHRCDMVRFFARGSYHRRSANDGSYTSPTTSNDAFITLGHLMLPTKDENSYIGPVADFPNVTNQLLETIVGGSNVLIPQVGVAGPTQRVGAYACDWVLGRSVMLLKDQTINTNAAGTFFLESAYPHYPYTINATNFTFPPAPPSGTVIFPYQANMTPLGSYVPDALGKATYYLTTSNSSRYDLAMTTPEQVRRSIADEVLQWGAAGFAGSHLWWNPLIYDLAANQAVVAEPYQASTSPPASYFANLINAATPPQYRFGTYAPAGAFTRPPSTGGPNAAPNLARMAGNPQVTTPLTSAAVAQLAPYFMQHCTQFIVEYAGDYLTQDSAPTPPNPISGQIDGIGPDGQIDYVIVTDAYGNRYKKIRWYGMPRSSNGGTANSYPGAPPLQNGPFTLRGYNPGVDQSTMVWNDLNTPPVTHGIMEQFVDVIPLRDYYSMYYNTVPTVQPRGNCLEYQPPWEVDVNFDPTGDYANNPQPLALPKGMNTAFQLNNTAVPVRNARYAAAWYDDMPAMIRILIKVDDPNNKLKDGPWYEFVFRLK
jgi:prepilin-type N-terminal cleavage/methylation domain-containing protein